MGFANIGPGSLLLILAIIVLLFGTKKLRSMGKDIGEAVKGFREGVDAEKDNDKQDSQHKE